MYEYFYVCVVSVFACIHFFNACMCMSIFVGAYILSFKYGVTKCKTSTAFVYLSSIYSLWKSVNKSATYTKAFGLIAFF